MRHLAHTCYSMPDTKQLSVKQKKSVQRHMFLCLDELLRRHETGNDKSGSIVKHGRPFKSDLGRFTVGIPTAEMQANSTETSCRQQEIHLMSGSTRTNTNMAFGLFSAGHTQRALSALNFKNSRHIISTAKYSVFICDVSVLLCSWACMCDGGSRI